MGSDAKCHLCKKVIASASDASQAASLWLECLSCSTYVNGRIGLLRHHRELHPDREFNPCQERVPQFAKPTSLDPPSPENIDCGDGLAAVHFEGGNRLSCSSPDDVNSFIQHIDGQFLPVSRPRQGIPGESEGSIPSSRKRSAASAHCEASRKNLKKFRRLGAGQDIHLHTRLPSQTQDLKNEDTDSIQPFLRDTAEASLPIHDSQQGRESALRSSPVLNRASAIDCPSTGLIARRGDPRMAPAFNSNVEEAAEDDLTGAFRAQERRQNGDSEQIGNSLLAQDDGLSLPLEEVLESVATHCRSNDGKNVPITQEQDPLRVAFNPQETLQNVLDEQFGLLRFWPCEQRASTSGEYATPNDAEKSTKPTGNENSPLLLSARDLKGTAANPFQGRYAPANTSTYHDKNEASRIQDVPKVPREGTQEDSATFLLQEPKKDGGNCNQQTADLTSVLNRQSSFSGGFTQKTTSIADIPQQIQAPTKQTSSIVELHLALQACQTPQETLSFLQTYVGPSIPQLRRMLDTQLFRQALPNENDPVKTIPSRSTEKPQDSARKGSACVPEDRKEDIATDEIQPNVICNAPNTPELANTTPEFRSGRTEICVEEENQLQLRKEAPQSQTAPRMVVCSNAKCSKKFVSEEEMRRHGVEEHQDDTTFCSVCLVKFKTRTNLARHTCVVHPADSKYSCKTCGIRFASAQARSRHAREIHDMDSVTGEKRATRIHYDAVFACSGSGCSYVSKSRHNLERHVKLRHGRVKNFVCSACGHRTGTKHNLQIHMTAHKTHREKITKEKNVKKRGRAG